MFTPLFCIDSIEDASQQFALDSFRQHLRQEIEAKHRNSMLNGLSITLNGSSLLARPDMLLHSDLIQPGYYQGQITHLGPQPISIQIYAGIGTSKPVEAGWNVYCNGRLVVAHDRTELTGWGDGVPRFHNQFAEFRGYTYLECENAALLPWNTTKSGIDVDSGVYRSVRQRMSELMRPVIDFLNRLDSETTADESDKPLTEAVNATKEVEVSKIPTAAIFTVAATPRIKAAVLPTRRIAYDRPREQIEQVQQVLEVTTLREVGEATFDYFYSLECRG